MWENSDKRSCQRIIPLPDYNADIVHGRKHLSKDDEEMINSSGQNSDLAYSYSSDVDNKENDEEESIKLSPVRASVYRHVLNEGTKFEVHRIDERFASQMSSPSFASSTLGQKKAAKRLTRSPPRPSLHRQGSGIPRHGRSVSKRDLMLSPPQASTVDLKRMLMSPPNEMNSGLRQRKIPPSPQDTPNTINLGSVFSPSTKSLKSIPFMPINSITDLNFSPPCRKKLATIDCFSDLPVVGEENTPLIKNKSTNSLNRQIKTGAPALSPKLESSSFTPNNIASARADAPKNSANKFAAAVQNSIREGLKKANQARTFGTAQMNGHPNKFGRGDSNSSNNRDVPARNSFTQLSSQSLVPEEPRYAAPSDLHKCCHEAENLEDLNFFAKEHFPHAKSLTPRGTTRFRSSPRQKSQILQWITQKDELGRLPIHVLSENKRLIRCNFECDANDFVYEETLYSLQEPNATSTRTIGQKNSSLKGNLHASFPFNRSPPLKMVGPKSNTIRSSSTAPLNLVDSQEYDLKGFAWDFIEQLVHLHPNGLTERDEEGHIPFVGSITRWVNFVYVKDTNSRQVNSRRNGVPPTGGMVVGGNEGYGISLNFHGVSHAINKLSAMKKTAQHSAKVHSSKNCLYDSSPFSTHDNTGKDSIPSFSNSKSLIGVFDNCVAPEETYIQTNIPHSTATLTESLAHHADLERKFESPSALSRPPLGKKSGTPIQQLPTSRRPPTKTPIKAESEASLQSLSSSNSTHKEDAREKQFPKRVKISPHVEWCLHMLSALIEHLEDSEQEERFSLLTAASNNNHTPVAALETPVRRDRVRIQAIGEKRISAFRGNVIKICHDMVHAVASIPFFIKTLLMIEDEAKREYIFSLTVVRRVVLNKASIGKWLTSMLSSERKSVPKRAVQYLELLSDVTGEDAMGASWAGSSSRDSKSIAQRQSDLYQTVGELDNLIPSMLALDEQMMEQAATSNIVKQVLDNMISRPFAVSVVFFDMLFLALLLIAFRCSVHAYLNWFSPNYILKWLYAANSCIFYFIIRELGKFVSFTMIARHLYGLKHFWSFWNIVDFASIAVTCTSVIILRMNVAAINGYPLDERSDLVRFLFTISTGLLWLRVLGLAKTINMQLATFVLAIVQVSVLVHQSLAKTFQNLTLKTPKNFVQDHSRYRPVPFDPSCGSFLFRTDVLYAPCTERLRRPSFPTHFYCVQSNRILFDCIYYFTR